MQDAWLARGPLACLLWPLGLAYGLVWRLREAVWRAGWWRAQRLPVPVIVVGNLVAGGAGKTPTVRAVVALLQRLGWRPGIISRGYGRAGDGLIDVQPDTPASVGGDEPLLLRLRAGVPVFVGRDRVAAGRELLRRHPQVEVIVSDDGLQHRRLARDAQVIVFDERGAGNRWLLPAGPLREPLPRGVPPRSVVLYNAAALSTPLPGWLAQRALGGVVPLRDWWQGAPSLPLHALAGRRCIAAAGLARPQRFFEMLRAAGLEIDPMPLPDHHDYAALPWPHDIDVIVTEKDAVKLDPARAGNARIWVATLDFTTGADFDAALAALLPLPPRPTPRP